MQLSFERIGKYTL